MKKLFSVMMTAVLLIAAMLPVLTVSANDAKTLSVPDDAHRFGDHYYKWYQDALDWSDAQKACEALGGHLVTITDEKEQLFVESICFDSSWIGGFREYANDWQWVTGEAFDYTNWEEGEPNNSDNVIPNENRIALWPRRWNDLNERSREHNGYVCEWDNIPPVTPTQGETEPASDISTEQPDPDRYEFNGHYYQVFYGAFDWSDAENLCEKLGGHLATVTDEKEQLFLESISDDSVWIGGLRVYANDWHWITGEPFAYTNWDEGEPNNSDNVIPNENHIALWPKRWNDLNEHSREQNGYVCEWDEFSAVMPTVPETQEPTDEPNFEKIVYDRESGISLSYDNDRDYALTVERITVDEIVHPIVGKKLAAYEITLLCENVEVQPDGKVRLSVPALSPKARIYRAETDNSVTDMNAVYQDGCLVFFVDHFSLYVLSDSDSILGDADTDGVVSVLDGTCIQKKLASINLSVFNTVAADTDEDGVVTVLDATTIQKKLARIPSNQNIGKPLSD